MQIAIELSALKRARWSEYALRFLFGGTITAITGLLAQRYGPVFGGLFLAFPAIFPASATLIEENEIKKQGRAGIVDTSRGRMAAALDARGAAMGSWGLVCFAVVVWKLLPVLNAGLCLAIATAAWLAVSVLIWRVGKLRHGKKTLTAIFGERP